MRIEEVPKTPTGNLGDLILSTFAAHDLLLEMESDENSSPGDSGYAEKTAAIEECGLHRTSFVCTCCVQNLWRAGR